MVNLHALTLLRNDPGVAAEMLAEAQNGDVHAQYAMGLIYAEGRGVSQDEARAFFWLGRAIEQGDEDARLLQQRVAAVMTAEQFDEAESLRKRYQDGKSSPFNEAIGIEGGKVH